MLSNSFRDIDVMPPFVGEFMRAQLKAMRKILLEAWSEPNRRKHLDVAIAHAIDFRAWQSLASHGPEPAAAAAIMTKMVGDVLDRDVLIA